MDLVMPPPPLPTHTQIAGQGRAGKGGHTHSPGNGLYHLYDPIYQLLYTHGRRMIQRCIWGWDFCGNNPRARAGGLRTFGNRHPCPEHGAAGGGESTRVVKDLPIPSPIHLIGRVAKLSLLHLHFTCGVARDANMHPTWGNVARLWVNMDSITTIN